MNNSSVQILAFDRFYKLAGVFSSYRSAYKITGVPYQTIYRCCHGAQVSARGFYWRELPADKEIECEDFGELTVIQLDQITSKNYRIYATSSMRIGEIIWESEYEKRFQIITKRKYGKNQSKNRK